MLNEFVQNFTHNLFKPLLLFFYAGFLIPIFHVKLEFPKAVYQGLTIYLLLSIGWHGGEELAGLEPSMYGQAAGFMLIGFLTNCLIGIATYKILRWTTSLRQVDAATVAGFYGSDSAGTFVTCMGVLTAGQIAFAPYMPVMLAVMEIPGCLVALYLVSKMRQSGMDPAGNMPGEAGYNRYRTMMAPKHEHLNDEELIEVENESSAEVHGSGVSASQSHAAVQVAEGRPSGSSTTNPSRTESRSHRSGDTSSIRKDGADRTAAEMEEAYLALQTVNPAKDKTDTARKTQSGWLSKELLHEVFLNPGIFLLFAGIAIGFIGRLQGERVTQVDDALFVNLFHGMLCVFLLEMGMTASSKLKDLRTAGWQFVAFALIAPNLFATMGMLIAHAYSTILGQPFELGTYVLFAVLCGAASYIAVPAVQRLAIPEASPTLPLAASLGVTFSYKVTVGIPVYLLIATLLLKFAPVG